MIRDDWLLRQISQLVDGLAGARSAIEDRVELDGMTSTFDDVARQLVGLSLDAIDRLPAVALLAATDGLEPARRKALAELLLLAAQLAETTGDPELGETRRTKARLLAT